MNPPRLTWSRYAWFAMGCCAYTVGVGAWAVWRGVAFWAITPGCLIAGLAGGALLSAACQLLRTGTMPRGRSFYRFSERPVTFVMDAVLIGMGLLLSALWPIGHALQEVGRAELRCQQGVGCAPVPPARSEHSP